MDPAYEADEVRGARPLLRRGARLPRQEAGALVPVVSDGARRGRGRVRRRHLAVDLRRVPFAGAAAGAARGSRRRVAAAASGRRRRGRCRRTSRSRSTRELEYVVVEVGRPAPRRRRRRWCPALAKAMGVAEPLARARPLPAAVTSRARRCRHPWIDRDRAGRARPTTSRSTAAPVSSTPRRATARRTTRPGSSYGLDVYAPVDGRGRFTDEVAEWRRRARLRRRPEDRRAPASRTARSSPRRTFPPQLPALLALQERRSSSAPPSSGSSAWSATTCAERALAEIDRVQLDPGVGPRAHPRHDRDAPRLVHLAPARLGRADRRPLLRGLRRGDREPGALRARGRRSSRPRAPTSGSSATSPSWCPPGIALRRVRRHRPSAARPTSSTSGSTRA